MANNQLGCVLHHVRKLIGLERESEATDCQLLERFVTRRDEPAFTTLVRRHGPMVQRVCRRILNDAHAAEDAFQATFLVLARKAASIRQRTSIGGWLYEVAYHLALRARAGAARRLQCERRPQDMPRTEATDETEEEGREVYAVLDEELHRLPEKYRTPLVLCYLEGKTNVQAAQEMGWPAGSMSSRLARAREILRDRLAGRGVVLSAGGLAALLAENAAPAAVSSPLVYSTVQAALMFSAGKASVAGVVSAHAVVLAEGMLNTMIATKLKWVMALVLAVGMLGTGTSAWIQQGTAAQAAAADQPAATAPAPANATGADQFGDPLPDGALARMGTVRWRHGGPVYYTGYTAQGKQLITASTDGFIRVWDVATGKEVRRFGKSPGNQAGGATGVGVAAMPFGINTIPNSVLLSPDGQTLAVIGNDGVVHLWDPATGLEIRTLGTVPQQGGRPVYFGASSLAFSADNKMLAVRSAGGAATGIRIWDVGTGKEIRQMAAGKPAGNRGVFNATGVNMLAFAPDGKTLAAASGEQEVVNNVGKIIPLVQMYDVESGKELRQIKAQDTNIFFGFGGVAFAPNGKGLAWAQTDGTIRLYDADTGKELQQLGQPVQGQVASMLLFSPDSKILATRTANNPIIRLWDVEKGNELRQLGEQPNVGGGNVIIRLANAGGGAALNFAFAPDAKTLAEGLSTHAVRIWDVSTGKDIPPAGGHQGGVSKMVLSPDGKVLTTRGLDNTIRQWDMATGQELRQFSLPPGTGNLIFSADAKTAILSAANNTIQVWDIATGKEVRSITVAAQQPFGRMFGGSNGMALSPDGATLAVKGNDALIRLYETATGKEMNPIAEQTGPAANPGGGFIISVNVGGSPILAFSPDGTLVATVGVPQAAGQPAVGIKQPGPATASNMIRLWSVSMGKMARQFETVQRGIAALAFAPDGRTIVTANTDNTISVWEVLTGKECLHIKANVAQGPAPVAPAPGQAIMMARNFTPSFSSIAIAPDGRTLATSTPDQTIQLWDLRTGTELGTFKGHQGGIMQLLFARDSRTVVSGSADTTALVWDGQRYIKKDAPATINLESKQLEELWGDLAADPVKAHKAIVTLATAPVQVVPLLRERVKPAAGVEAKRIEQLIADLDNPKFDIRQKANDDLEKLAELAQPALQKALDANPALETRQRIEKLLDRMVLSQTPPVEVARAMRAVRVLEQVGTPEACAILQALAKGAPGDRLTRDAESSLKRLGK